MTKTVIIVMIFISLLESVQAQKGEKSISLGPLISFPLDRYIYPRCLKSGVGLEAIGQYNFSNKSALLLQTILASYGIRRESINYCEVPRSSISSLKGGYRYQFANTGFFTNVLAGIDSYDGFTSISFTFGAGKRFTVKNVYFIDTGIDYIDGDTESRVNIKATFSLLRRPKIK